MPNILSYYSPLTCCRVFYSNDETIRISDYKELTDHMENALVELVQMSTEDPEIDNGYLCPDPDGSIWENFKSIYQEFLDGPNQDKEQERS